MDRFGDRLVLLRGIMDLRILTTTTQLTTTVTPLLARLPTRLNTTLTIAQLATLFTLSLVMSALTLFMLLMTLFTR
jgi:hypothetical protein